MVVFTLSIVLQCTCGFVHDLKVLHDCLLIKFTLFVAFLILMSAIYFVNKDYFKKNKEHAVFCTSVTGSKFVTKSVI